MATQRELDLFARLLEYSKKYEISFQMWPDQKTIYIAKDGVDLTSYGSSDAEWTMRSTLDYLDRINKKDVSH
jgi:hypothetical protein